MVKVAKIKLVLKFRTDVPECHVLGDVIFDEVNQRNEVRPRRKWRCGRSVLIQAQLLSKEMQRWERSAHWQPRSRWHWGRDSSTHLVHRRM